MSVTSEVLEIVKAMPGIRSTEIVELMPHVKITQVSGILTTLFARGEVTREGPFETSRRGRGYYRYTVNPDPTPAPAVVKPPKKTAPSESALQLRVDQLTYENFELRKWKEAAIERFPDLGVEQIVLDARQIVAKMLRESPSNSDAALAAEVLAGRKDGSLSMRATIEALSRV